MRTIDERFKEPVTVNLAPIHDLQQGTDSAVINLHDAIHTTAKCRQGDTRAMRLSMTTLVIDLALAVKRKISHMKLGSV